MALALALVGLGAAAAVAIAALRDGRAGRPWLVLGGALLLRALGQLLHARGGAASFPHPADAFYGLAYVGLVAAVVQLTALSLHALRRSHGGALEAALFVAAAAVAGWELAVEPAGLDTRGEALAITALVADALLTAVVVYGWIVLRPVQRRLPVLAAAFAVYVVADAVYARDLLLGGFVPGSASDAIRVAAYVLFVAAAVLPAGAAARRVELPRPSAGARAWGLLVPMVVPLALLVIRPHDLAVRAVAVAMCFVVVARLASLLHENAGLAETRAHAVSLLRATIDGTEDAILVTDGDGRPVLHNRQLVEMWHLPPKLLASPEAVAAHMREQVAEPDDLLPATRSHFDEPNRVGVDEISLRDGRVIRRSSRPQLLDGRPVGRVWSYRDVTLQRAAESALVAATARLHETLSKARLYVVSVDPDLRIVFCNDHFLAATGWKRRQLLGRLWHEVMLPDATAVQIAREARLRHLTEPTEFHENDLLTRSGVRRRVAWNSSASYTLAGELESVTLIGFDITAQKELEEELRRRERRSRALLEKSMELVLVVDADARILDDTGVGSAILGFEPGELIGSSVIERVHPKDAERALAVHRRVLASAGEFVAFELRALHKDGRTLVLNGFSTNLLDDPDVAGIVVNARDVTEAHAAAQELQVSREQFLHAQKLEAVARLAGGVAHDFNNLLTAIRGYSELMLLSLEQGDPVRHDAEEIRDAAERAASLTRQLLAFSRRQVLQPAVVGLNEIVEGMESLLRRLIGEDVRLVTSLAPDLGSVRADPGQLEQVLANLVVNARDAMPDGGTVEISTERVTLAGPEDGLAAGDYVALRVSDTGVGIDEDTAAHVFEPFFTTKTNGEGTGLGLATVYGIVSQSGGGVSIDSRPGEGTRVEVLLPRVGEAPQCGEPELPAAAAGSETVLLVEDEALVRDLAHRVLEERGYAVLTVDESPQAVTLCAEYDGTIDLLLTDVVMPYMNGRELAERVRELRPELKVLYMSGYTGHEVLSGVRDDARTFLQKPFTPDVLAQRVRDVLDAA